VKIEGNPFVLNSNTNSISKYDEYNPSIDNQPLKKQSQTTNSLKKKDVKVNDTNTKTSQNEFKLNLSSLKFEKQILELDLNKSESADISNTNSSTNQISEKITLVKSNS